MCKDANNLCIYSTFKKEKLLPPFLQSRMNIMTQYKKGSRQRRERINLLQRKLTNIPQG
jgi:hypothetical protein